jgi:glutamate racemase
VPRSGAEAPILFLDSGVGGLSILDAVATRLPLAPLVYCADVAGYPYGTKSEPEISARVAGLLGRLVERVAPRLVVIACNTASTIALAAVRGVLGDVPIVGTVPAIKPAAARTATGVIGVLGTEATVRQPYVDRLVADFAGGCTVLRHGDPALVEAAEAMLAGDAPERAIFARSLAGLLAQPGGDRLDTVVLACTHFPLVVRELVAAAPRDLAFLDGAEGIARRCAQIVDDTPWPGERPAGRVISTADTAGFRRLAPAFGQRGLTRMETL